MTTIVQGVDSGVSFALTEEQKNLRELARDFAKKEIRPKAAEYDEHQTHPADVIAKAHDLGLMNLHVPESLGGPGLTTFEGILVAEELNWGCSGIGTSIGANGLGSGPVIIAETRSSGPSGCRRCSKSRSSARSGSPSPRPDRTSSS